MNEELVRRHNYIVQEEDTVYVLGDLMMGPDIESGMELIKQMKGKKIIVRGNHDSDKRVKAYEAIYPVHDALRIKYNGYNFFLCHYPTMTANFESHIKACTISLHGHTHQQTNFYEEMPWIFHVGVDSHNCFPISIDEVIKDINEQVKNCEAFL